MEKPRLAPPGRLRRGVVSGMGKDLIRIHPSDDVAVALRDIAKNTEVEVAGQCFVALDDIPMGHKMALRDLRAGENIRKYGSPIGHVTQDVSAGSWLHSHNVRTNLEGLLDYQYRPVSPSAAPEHALPDTFRGYLRPDGRAATRNEIWVIPTVSCVNPLVRDIAEQASALVAGQCDGVFALPHNTGCSQMGEDQELTKRLLAAIVRHPNAGGVLLVSLGCENVDFEHFLPVLGDYDHARIRTMVAQDVPGDETAEGVRLVREIAALTAQDRREELPVSKLVVGMKCGGSDGFSGITANPLCGTIAEKLTALGGTAILTEVPGMFGAETFLMERADSEETFQKIVCMINGFKQYYLDHDQPVYDNPSPGNKRGGITTLEEKSLGCIQKGGHAVVTDTLEMGEACRKPGLNLVTGPGNDSVSITNLLAAGAQLLLFTTGRGNPLGTAIPTLKLASNPALFERKRDWLDFNAGMILEESSMEAAAELLWKQMIRVASGETRARNEERGYREIMIFKDGVIL